MNVRFFLIISWVFLIQNACICQVKIDSIEQINYLKQIVCFLASDSLYGRETSSISERKAADFIYSSFKDIKNLKPKRHCFSFQRSDSSTIQFSQNIYCYVNNHADSTILIGAHYDHIGMGGELSLAYSKKKPNS